MTSEIELQITALVAATLRVDQAMVSHDAAFATDLGADSLDLVAMFLAVEAQFR